MSIKYIDKSYDDKRKILRRFYVNDTNSQELVSYILHHADEPPKELMDLPKQEILLNLLVDGYVSFERIFDEHKNIIYYSRLDPLSLSIQPNHGKSVWISTHRNNKERILEKEQIVYLTYNELTGSDNTSLVEQVMNNGLNKKDHATYINILIDNVYKIYEKFDVFYERRKKLERILK